MYNPKLVNPIIHLELRPRIFDGFNEKVFLGLVGLYSNPSRGILRVCFISFLQVLVIGTNESFYPFLGPILCRFIYSSYILNNWQVKHIASPLKSTGL